MSIPSYYYRKMLHRYDRQLVTARRLARLEPERERPNGLLRLSQADLDKQAEEKRQAMVVRIARELLENLLFAGSANPVVQEIRQELEQALEERLSFWYPPGETEVRIVRECADGPEELTAQERARVLTALWEITLAKVDQTML